MFLSFFFFSSRRRHTRYIGDWSSDVCSSDLTSTALVMVMTVGLAFFYGGLVRPKNALNTMMMSIVALGLRSEERRVGKEGRSRGARDQEKKKKQRMKIYIAEHEE